MGKISPLSKKSFYLMEPEETQVKVRCFNETGKVSIFAYFPTLHEATKFGNQFVEEQDRRLKNIQRWQRTKE